LHIWRLRSVTADDTCSLHALACEPLVYRFLFDGAPPSVECIANRVAQAIASTATPGMGMLILEDSSARCWGCVELRPYPAARSAEITYLLHPQRWGEGVATRMTWTAITHVFQLSHIDQVIAGHDLPNTASFAVMRRLGMRFHKNVQYPLGAGAEYILHRSDHGPIHRPALMPVG
jgi:[ribosomal protein S5]-alanine N-acetyltransferase